MTYRHNFTLKTLRNALTTIALRQEVCDDTELNKESSVYGHRKEYEQTLWCGKIVHYLNDLTKKKKIYTNLSQHSLK